MGPDKEPLKSNSVQTYSNAKTHKHIPVIALLLASTTAGFLGGWVGSDARGRNIYTGTQQARQEIVLNESQVISDIAKNVGESVVSVNVVSETVTEDLFGSVRPSRQESAGTGFIISDSGYVVTNRHVIPEGANSVTITLSDGTELDQVEVVGRTRPGDPLDVAFLRIKDKKGKALKPATLGDSSKVRVGDKVIAIGNALGQFQNTVTAGIISGYGRNVEASDDNGVESLQNLFQTDASINQGNSGGPLVNINGEVIGINTAVAGGGAENIGFAIPLNDASGLITSVLKEGKLLRPYLGVRYILLTDDIAYEFNLPVERGAYVAPRRNAPSIVSGSPAEKAGVKEKDIITKVNNQTIDESHSLISVLGKFSVGDEITLTIVRDGKEQQLKAKLEAAPEG